MAKKTTKPLPLHILNGKIFNIDEFKIPQWQINLLDERMKNASPDSFKNWNEIKDRFKLD